MTTLLLLDLILLLAWLGHRAGQNRRRAAWRVPCIGRASPAARALMLQCNPALHIAPGQTMKPRP